MEARKSSPDSIYNCVYWKKQGNESDEARTMYLPNLMHVFYSSSYKEPHIISAYPTTYSKRPEVLSPRQSDRLVSRVRISEAVSLFPPYAFIAQVRKTLPGY
jgi:hypothetical protein